MTGVASAPAATSSLSMNQLIQPAIEKPIKTAGRGSSPLSIWPAMARAVSNQSPSSVRSFPVSGIVQARMS
jgi:hypothetical protein